MGGGAWQGAWLTGGVDGLLHFLAELLPVAVTHGRVLEVLDEGHGPLEGVDTGSHRPTDGPLRLVLERGTRWWGKGGREGYFVQKEGRTLHAEEATPKAHNKDACLGRHQ